MSHRGQFAILRKRSDSSDLRYIDLPDGWILNCHKDLPVFYIKEKQIILIGYVWQAMPGKCSPSEEIRRLAAAEDGRVSERELLSVEETWCGRYILISGSRVYTDAASQMGVFYCKEGISSELDILAEQLGEDLISYEPREHVNWMPGPRTPYRDIRRLLASQSYDYETGSLKERPLFARSYTGIPDRKNRTEKFVEIFSHSLNEMAACYRDRKILVALSGGYDSRCTFSIARKAGLDISAFTFGHDGMLEDDHLLPARICEKTGTEHVYIERDHGRYDPDAEALYQKYTGGLVRDEDRNFFAYQQYHDLVEKYGKVLILRGGIWEVIRDYFGSLFDGDDLHPYYYQQLQIPEDSLEKRSLDEYFSWCESDPEELISLKDRLFLEQDSGCWLSYIEHGFDFTDEIMTVQPLNCRMLITMLLDYSEDERKNTQHEVDITLCACPELSGIPYAGTKIEGETPVGMTVRKIKRFTQRVRNVGFPGAVSYYIKRLTRR